MKSAGDFFMGTVGFDASTRVLANQPTAMIEIEGLTKNFGRIAAVSGIDLRVHKGEVLGFLGPNGAGKSTTMKMIAGYLTPERGPGVDLRP